MKEKTYRLVLAAAFALCLIQAPAQEIESEQVTPQTTERDNRPVKDVFSSNWLIGSQTAIVPNQNAMEFDINHRFGSLKNGKKDMFGLYAPTNIRLGLTYTPLKNLQIGAGMTKEKMMYDLNLKWNPVQQTRSGSSPFFVTFFGNMTLEGEENTRTWAINDIHGNDSLTNNKYPKYTDRISYFGQIIIGRKIFSWLSLQVAPSFSHYNLIDTMQHKNLRHDNFSLAVAAKIRLYGELNFIAEYVHPFTPAKGVKPNLAFGIEASTSAHAFQLFLSPYSFIVNQRDVVFNRKDPRMISDYALGFNVTRIWNF